MGLNKTYEVFMKLRNRSNKYFIIQLVLAIILLSYAQVTFAQTQGEKPRFPFWEKVRENILKAQEEAKKKKEEKETEKPFRRKPPSGHNFSSKFPNRKAFDRYVQEGWDSPFGLDYVFVLDPKTNNPKIIDLYGDTVGIRWVNFAKVGWDQIEKRRPQGNKHFYNWILLDKAVTLWQKHGVHIMMSLRVRNPWGTQKPTDKNFVYQRGLAKKLILATTDYLPKSKHMDDYREFISNLVERYDGDGKDDMPGLLFPVLY